MPYVAIMKTDGAKCAKYQIFDTQTGADDHVVEYAGSYPDAYVVPQPAYPLSQWVCDPVAKTVSDGGPAAPTSLDVNAERDRRVLVGREFTPAGYSQPIAVAGDPITQTNLLALATAAQARLAAGDTTTLTKYRDENNNIHDLTPFQVFDLWSQGAAYVSDVYQASWEIKDDPAGISADFASDPRWP